MTNHNPSKSWDIEARARSEGTNAFAGVESGPSPLQEVVDPLLVSAGVRLYVKRDDLRDDAAAGNKLRKLKYNLAAAQ